MFKDHKKLNERDIVYKLILTYPNSISIEVGYGDSARLNFVETVSSFADHIINDFTESEQKRYFGACFKDADECERYLTNYMHSLNEMCQGWIDENYYVVDGELYYKVDDEEDDIVI